LADRADFFAAAAQIMRRILVDLAREACTSVEGGLGRFPYDRIHPAFQLRADLFLREIG